VYTIMGWIATQKGIADVWNRIPANVRSWLSAAEAFVWLAVISAALEYPFSDLGKENGVRNFLAKVGVTALAALRVYAQKHPFRTVVAELVTKPDGTMQEVVYGQGQAVDSGSHGQDEAKGNSGEVRQSDEEKDRSGKESGRPA